jgi:hypothetical protein
MQNNSIKLKIKIDYIKRLTADMKFPNTFKSYNGDDYYGDK